MNAPVKLAAFGAVLAFVFGGALAVGAAVGPIDIGSDGNHTASHSSASAVEVALPEPSPIATIDDYTVTMTGDPMVGEATLTFTVQRDGAVVRTDPYFDAAGHLVVIRAQDLAYLHVHPQAGATTEAVTFVADLPTAGLYRLFFDFSHGGSVHTAAFTVDVAASPAGGTDGPTVTHGGGH